MALRITERVKNWFASLASVNGQPVPPTGRSSQDQSLANRVSAFAQTYTELAPGLNFDVLTTLKWLAIFNPDFAQAVSNLVALGNTGHTVVIDAASSARAEAAQSRLNEAASRIYPNSDGVDGLIRDAIKQVAWSGAFSREDVINLTGRRVERVVLVPPDEVRFFAKDGQWQPYQMPVGLLGLTNISPNGYVELHPTTYRYFGLEHIDNSPYAVPPFTAALEPILDVQDDMRTALKKIVQKYGLFGLLTASVTPRSWDRSKETYAEYLADVQRYLTSVRQSFESALTASKVSNLIVTAKGQSVEVTPTTHDSKGAADLFTQNEQQVFSGLRSMPWAFGRNDTTTETFADVVWYLLQAQAMNIQGLVRRGMERTYFLDLLLGGIQVNGVSVKFNAIKSRNLLQEYQAKQAEQALLFEQARNGIIDADEVAQRLGYESAFDASRLNGVNTEAGASAGSRATRAKDGALSVEFRYDRDARRYRFVPQRVELSASSVTAGIAGGNVIRMAEKKKSLAPAC